MEVEYSLHHAADLAANLPPDSRCGIFLDPLNAWTLELQLLARIEHHLALWNWAHSKDASDANRPKLLMPTKDGEKASAPNAPVTMPVDEMMHFVDGLISKKEVGEDV